MAFSTHQNAHDTIADNTTLTRLERQTGQTVAELSRRAQVAASDAAVVTEAWPDLAAWPDTLGSPGVNTGKLVGTSGSAYGKQRPLALGATESWCGRFAIRAGASSSYVYVFVNNDANGTINAAIANGMGLGFTSNGTVLAPFKGTNCSGSTPTGVGSATITAGTDYFLTITIDETYVAMSVQTETGEAPFYAISFLRTQLPSGPTINQLTISGVNNNNPAICSVGSISYIRALTVPPSAYRTVNSKVLFANAKNVMHIRTDAATGIRHMIGIPGDLDNRIPAPLAACFHAYSEDARYAFRIPTSLDERASGITKALLAAGYIVVASDNGTSVAAGADDQKFGNQAGCDDYVASIRYARAKFGTSGLFLYGASMGGEFIENLIAQRAIGGIAAAALVCPGLDLVAIEANATYTSAIRSAYGAADNAAFLVAIAGRNPIDYQGYRMRAIPQKFYVASSDPTAPPATHVEPLRTRLLDYAAEAPNVTVTSSTHADQACYQPSDVLAFFEKYRNSTA